VTRRQSQTSSRRPPGSNASWQESRDYAALLTAENYFPIDAGDEGKRAGLLLPLLDALIDGMRDVSGASEAERAQ
jgi:hypothetical protein